MKIMLSKLVVSSAVVGVLAIGSCAGSPGVAWAASASAASSSDLQTQIAGALASRLPTYEMAYSGNAKTLKKDINQALNAAIEADDYTRYIVKSYSYKAVTTGGVSIVTFQFTYWETAAQTQAVQAKVAEVLGQIVTADMNDYEKEKAIHDWIVSHIAYDSSLKSHSAYDGLILGKTVCQGYALIAYEMLRQAHIPVRIEEGRARGQAHAWNLVQLGGAWYQLDCTWDDPVPDVPGRVQYDYFNLTDAELRADHSWTIRYPAANTKYNQTLTALVKSDAAKAAFYNKLYDALGYSYMLPERSAKDLKELTAKLQTAIDHKETEVTIRYARGAAVTADMKKAMSSLQAIKGISYTASAYTRTQDNDKLLVIKLSY